MEYDADWGAMRACIHIERLEFDEKFSHVFDPDDRLEYSMFAIYAMTWLLSTVVEKHIANGYRSHPEPTRRLSLLFRGANAILATDDGRYIRNNYYAYSQLRAIEFRIKSGWMNFNNPEEVYFDPKDHESVARKMRPFSFGS